MNLSQAERTAAIARSLSNGRRLPLASFDSRKYIQHNLNIGDGLAPILEFMDSLPSDRTRSNVVRQFEDGDYSVVHADYELGDWGPMIGFEVHRWENDRIVEHWDNLCATPTALNPSGHSLIDGETGVSDLDLTEDNRQIIEHFTNQVLVRGSVDAGSPFFHDGQLIQHSASYGDGVDAFRRQLKLWRTQGGLRYDKVHKVLGQGNMFLVMSEGVLGGKPAAFYDLYLLSRRHIVEHWEVFETIPSRDRWKNDNGKF